MNLGMLPLRPPPLLRYDDDEEGYGSDDEEEVQDDVQVMKCALLLLQQQSWPCYLKCTQICSLQSISSFTHLNLCCQKIPVQPSSFSPSVLFDPKSCTVSLSRSFSIFYVFATASQSNGCECISSWSSNPQAHGIFLEANIKLFLPPAI